MGGDIGRAAAVVSWRLQKSGIILWLEMPFGAGPSVVPPPLPSWKMVHWQGLSCEEIIAHKQTSRMG